MQRALLLLELLPQHVEHPLGPSPSLQRELGPCQGSQRVRGHRGYRNSHQRVLPPTFVQSHITLQGVLRRLFYWLAVLAISLALLVALVLLLAGRDSSSIGATSLANTTIL